MHSSRIKTRSSVQVKNVEKATVIQRTDNDNATEYILPHFNDDAVMMPQFSDVDHVSTANQAAAEYVPVTSDTSESVQTNTFENAFQRYQICWGQSQTPETELDYSNDSSFSNLLPHYGARGNAMIDQLAYEEQDVDSPDTAYSDDNLSDSPPKKKTKAVTKGSFACKKPLVILQWNRAGSMQCLWKHCKYISDVLEDFVKHVSYHVPELESKVNDDDIEVYFCKWKGCKFETDDGKKIMRHVNFHAYHTKLKSIGTNVLNLFDVPECRCTIPDKKFSMDIENPFFCHWDDCDHVFNNPQLFYSHVGLHVRNSKVKSGYFCSWEKCTKKFNQLEKLKVHVRSHTHEKVVGCPTCGSLFASKDKFIDHCKRQLPNEMQKFQCSYCTKYYASHCLLREHMRNHVNNYKCSFCDMTCRNPSALAMHIRYRHLKEKPFKCKSCDLRFKTSYDLNKHIDTHSQEDPFQCGEEGCTYSSRTARALQFHIHRDHYREVIPSYYCHICPKCFISGSKLTKHLFTEHELRWPSGHSKFWYRQDKDGIYRLQTVRYESLELTEKMMQEKPACEGEKVDNRSFLLKEEKQDDVMSFVVTEVSEEACNSVLISIEEVDDEGNVMNTEVYEVESQPGVIDERAKVICSGEDILNTEGTFNALPNLENSL